MHWPLPPRCHGVTTAGTSQAGAGTWSSFLLKTLCHCNASCPIWNRLTFIQDLNQSVTFVWILIRTNIRIYSYRENDTNEYPNIFVWKFLARTNIRIYSYQNFDTNEYPNKYSDRKYSNIRIYSSYSGLDWHRFCAFTI